MPRLLQFIVFCAIALLPVSGARADSTLAPVLLAQDAIALIPQSAEAQAVPVSEKGADVILLIDSSGSMKRTDPKDYRKDAAKLFISLLGKDDRIGVMSFGDAATTLIPLTQNRSENRETLFQAVDKISSRELTTNITDALHKGFEALKKSPKQNRILVMMSDGKLDLGTPAKDAVANEELKKLPPELAKEKIRIYTVAFTDEADRALLENMAQETGGSFRFAKKDKDVHLMFASIFEAIKSPDSVPFEGESFSIDNEIKEATVLVTKKEGASLILVDPLNNRYTASMNTANIKWFESPLFDMITIETPAPGKWSVKLSSNEGNKVYIVTDLSLKASLDRDTVSQGDHVAINAWLENQGSIVEEQNILQNTTFTTTVSGPDGKMDLLNLVSTVSPTSDTGRQGEYRTRYTVSAVGDYSLTVRARGKTFVREKILSFRAVEPSPVQVAEQQEPAPQQVPQPEPVEDGVSWGIVLLKLAIINLVLIGVAAVVMVLRKKNFFLKRKSK